MSYKSHTFTFAHKIIEVCTNNKECLGAPHAQPNTITHSSLKPKTAKESDMFKTNKRPKCTENIRNFAQEYQEEQRKVQDGLSMRPDMLEGAILPPKAIPQGTYLGFGGKTKTGDPDKMYRYVAMHGDSNRVKKNRYISEAQRRMACANFPSSRLRSSWNRKKREGRETLQVCEGGPGDD
jgi:hypothetical protein